MIEVFSGEDKSSISNDISREIQVETVWWQFGKSVVKFQGFDGQLKGQTHTKKMIEKC